MQSVNSLLKTNNVTMNNVVNKLTNNDNVTMNNVNYNSKDAIADKLCDQLANPGYRAFYCKVAYRLNESQIWSALEIAKNGNNPAKYFSWLVKKMGA